MLRGIVPIVLYSYILDVIDARFDRADGSLPGRWIRRRLPLQFHRIHLSRLCLVSFQVVLTPSDEHVLEIFYSWKPICRNVREYLFYYFKSSPKKERNNYEGTIFKLFLTYFVRNDYVRSIINCTWKHDWCVFCCVHVCGFVCACAFADLYVRACCIIMALGQFTAGKACLSIELSSL